MDIKLYLDRLPILFFCFWTFNLYEEIIDKSLLMSVSLIISNLFLNYILIDVTEPMEQYTQH